MEKIGPAIFLVVASLTGASIVVSWIEKKLNPSLVPSYGPMLFLVAVAISAVCVTVLAGIITRTMWPRIKDSCTRLVRRVKAMVTQ